MTKTNKFQINWSDENDDNDLFAEEQNSSASDSSNDFSQLLNEEKETAHSSQAIRVGEKVSGTLVKISAANDIFVDLQYKLPGVIARSELVNENTGELSYKEGDVVEAFIVSINAETVVMSRSLSHKVTQENTLRGAWENKIPVKGKISSVNKGGYEIELMGKKAFCPLSQIETYYVEDTASYIGKTLDFIIVSYQKNNILLSRKKFLEQKARARITELYEQLDEEPEVTGKVVALKDFGAVVSVDSVPAFLHISEIAFSHVSDINEYLSIGQVIKARVLDITGDFSSDKMPRVSLSMKSLQDDPWDSLDKDFSEGASYNGKVVRLCPFGAFVSLKPGVEGLLHISEMSWIKKIRKPEELLAEGDIINVRILEIDSFKQQIKLSLKAIEEDPWHKLVLDYPVGSEHEVEVLRLKPFGALVQVKEGVVGLLPQTELRRKFGQSFRKKSSPGEKISVVIRNLDAEERKILLGFPDQEFEGESQSDFRDYIVSEPKKEEESKEKNSEGKSLQNTGAQSTLGDAFSAAFKKTQKKKD